MSYCRNIYVVDEIYIFIIHIYSKYASFNNYKYLPISLVVFFNIFILSIWFLSIISSLLSKALLVVVVDAAVEDVVSNKSPSSNDWNNSPLPGIKYEIKYYNYLILQLQNT